MGASITKVAKRKNSQKKSAAKKVQNKRGRFCLGDGAEEGNAVDIRRSVEGPVKKRKSLQELHMNPPPGFRKFEAEVPWQTIDEKIALQLWEDVFKPLYTFRI